MPRYGSHPDVERREQVAKLRTKGLTFTEIGKRLGMSRQAAHSLLFRTDRPVQLPGIACRECRKEICSWNPRWHGGMKRGQLVYCLQCLGKHPEVRLGERLLAFRISAGMTRGDLEKQTGVDRNTIGQCERDGCDPFWSTLARLVEYFGPELLGLGGRGRRARATVSSTAIRVVNYGKMGVRPENECHAHSSVASTVLSSPRGKCQ